ncbi:hypothetical protein HYDPIDRAFT_31597 [Hydnomerulius pinastri MD-312]|uniref:ATP phosphoribosyltransferase n=1 Tax=Hydnomerulius pinastri MD-312 TaxID=994086 RepID=A0A0C9VT43_9AGAM|nr:hypothetical protein HYDPIDRAFT_31597 [Hydnomerulius pinastri MD-312]
MSIYLLLLAVTPPNFVRGCRSVPSNFPILLRELTLELAAPYGPSSLQQLMLSSDPSHAPRLPLAPKNGYGLSLDAPLLAETVIADNELQRDSKPCETKPRKSLTDKTIAQEPDLGTGMNVESLNGRLLFAIPKKGRLYDKCIQLLAGADIQFRRSNRLDVCLVMNHPIALVFLPAADIPSFVGNGNVDLGITGHDVILEAKMQDKVTEIQRLGFGKCALQVQVPERAPIKSVEDLAGKRVVTSFEVLAGEYFNKIDDQLSLVGDQKTKIQYVGGSVEAACALGLADGIVDLVESGDTMRAAGLHAIATLLQTEAVLIKSTVPSRADHTPLINLIASRIAGVVAAEKYVVCSYNISRAALPQAVQITPGRRAPTISPLEKEDWVDVSAMVEKKDCATVMDQLVKIGAEDVLIFNLDNCRV